MAPSQAKASARLSSIAKPHPLLVEQELTAGTLKHKHVIGVELEFSKSLDPSLARDIARRFSFRPGHGHSYPTVSAKSNQAHLTFDGDWASRAVCDALSC